MKTIYSDGFCLQNPNNGGWAIYLHHNQKDIKVYGYEGLTTKHQMELKAAIIAAQFVEIEEEAIIYLNSEYVRKGLNEWIAKWKRTNWQTSYKNPVKNKELWIELDNLNQTRKITWVASNQEHIGNELIKKLVKHAAAGQSNDYLLQGFLNFVLKKEPIKPVIRDLKLLDRVLFNENPYFILQEIKNENGVKGFLIINLTESIYISDVSLLSYTTQDETEKFNVINTYKDKLSQVYYEAKHKCQHEIEESSYESAECKFCKENFGWYCEESPDHVCHYFSTNRKVTLINNEEVDVPEEHNDRYETDDCCIFCGSPEERK